MEIIREARGKAKEYAPLVLELYENKNGNVKPARNALERLAKDAASLKERGNQHEILLSHKSDPYPDEEIELNITEGAIKILIENNLEFSILTEKAENALQHFDFLEKYKKARYGTKLLSNSNGQSLNIEEPPLFFRIEAIKEANKRGIKTWVDLDPSSKPALAQELVRRLYKVVDQWKVGEVKFEPKPMSRSNWEIFEKETEGLLDSSGYRSPWMEGDISTRRGNCNILVIAPHGHPGDDTGSYELSKRISDELDCYAVVNKKYRKPQKAGLKQPSVTKFAVDLNQSVQINKFSKTKKQFLEPIETYKKEILSKNNSLLILHIHGIGDDNREKVAALLPEYKKNPETLHLLIGYGQHRTDTTRITADLSNLVKPLIADLGKQRMKAAKAPTEHIFVKIGKKSEKRWYCGNDKKRLNQNLCKPKDKVQSLQLEFKKGGLRDKSENIEETAHKLSAAIKTVFGLETKEQNQNVAAPEAATSEMHEIYTNFMAIFQRKSETTMLEAGRYLFKTFYNNKIKTVKGAKKKEPLNSLHQYIKNLHGEDPTAPKKSWIYNAVDLVIDHETIKAHSDELFHMYGKLSLSHKVLLFPLKDMGSKERLIEYAGAHQPTVVEFREKIAKSKSGNNRKVESKPSLLKIIANPEKLFTDEMSKFITPGALKELPSPALERLQREAKNSIAKMEANITLEKDYIKRYQKLIENLKKTARLESEEHSPELLN